jgi:hypothetical protein
MGYAGANSLGDHGLRPEHNRELAQLYSIVEFELSTNCTEMQTSGGQYQFSPEDLAEATTRCVPSTTQGETPSEVHSSPTGGHSDVEKTAAAVQAHFC